MQQRYEMMILSCAYNGGLYPSLGTSLPQSFIDVSTPSRSALSFTVANLINAPPSDGEKQKRDALQEDDEEALDGEAGHVSVNKLKMVISYFLPI